MKRLETIGIFWVLNFREALASVSVNKLVKEE
jgi:hypothetical protein